MKKLNTKSFKFLIIAIIISIAASIAGGIIVIINYKPLFDLSLENGSVISASLMYLFLRAIIVFVVIVLLNFVWLISLIKDKKKARKKNIFNDYVWISYFFCNTKYAYS